jgi:hypothetical protein
MSDTGVVSAIQQQQIDPSLMDCAVTTIFGLFQIL